MSDDRHFLSLVRHYHIYQSNLDIIRTLHIQSLQCPIPRVDSGHQIDQLELMLQVVQSREGEQERVLEQEVNTLHLRVSRGERVEQEVAHLKRRLCIP